MGALALRPLLNVAARQESPAGEAVHGAIGLAEERPHATPPRGRLVQWPNRPAHLSSCRAWRNPPKLALVRVTEQPHSRSLDTVRRGRSLRPRSRCTAFAVCATRRCPENNPPSSPLRHSSRVQSRTVRRARDRVRLMHGGRFAAATRLLPGALALGGLTCNTHSMYAHRAAKQRTKQTAGGREPARHSRTQS